MSAYIYKDRYTTHTRQVSPNVGLYQYNLEYNWATLEINMRLYRASHNAIDTPGDLNIYICREHRMLIQENCLLVRKNI